MQSDIQDKIASLLARCVDMTVATVGPEGAPEATVVSFVHDGLLLYFGCGATSRKAANLARDPRVSVTITAPYGSWREIEGLSLSASAEPVTVPGESAKVADLMRQRFPQIAQFEPSAAADVRLFRVRPRVISVLDYARGFGHADLVRIGPDDVAESLDSMRHHWLVPAA